MGKSTDGMIPVASLARVSSVGQAKEDRAGLPRQRIAISEAVTRHGLHVVQAFELPGVSGHLVGQTPEWAAIRRLLDEGAIRGVVCDSVDRLCRASELDLSVLADIQRVGGSIYTPGEVRDLSSSTDGLVAGLLALLGGVEKASIVRRANEARKAMRADGRWTHDPKRLPMGVSYDPKTFEWSYTDDVRVIVDLARRYASGEGSIRTLAARLGLSYAKARNGLSSPMYRGRMKDLRGGFVTILEPPAIDDKLAARIDARRASQVRKYNGAGRRLASTGHDPFLLRDVVMCNRCGGRTDTTVNRTRHKKTGAVYETRYYRCAAANRPATRGGGGCDGPAIRIDDVHHAVVTALLHHLTDKDATDAAQAAIELPDDPRPGELDRLRGRVAELESQRTRLLRVYTRGLIDEGEFETERAEVDRLLDAVRVELRGLEAERVEIESAQMALIRFYQSTLVDLSRGDHDAICAALRQAGGRVSVDRVSAPWPWGQTWTTRDGVLVPAWNARGAERRGWFVLVAWADLDVSRGLGLGAVENARRVRSKNGSSAPWTDWSEHDTPMPP